MLRRQRAIEIVPASEPFRRRRYDVPQHRAPETSDALRFCAVEGDLDLLDRRHQPTIKAGCWTRHRTPREAGIPVMPAARGYDEEHQLRRRWAVSRDAAISSGRSKNNSAYIYLL